MKKMTTVLALGVFVALIGGVLFAPVISAASEGQATMSATIAVVIDVDVSPTEVYWATIAKGTTDGPCDNNPFKIVIKSTTTVETDGQVQATALTSGSNTIPVGSIKIKNSDNTSSYVLTTSYETLTWIDNAAVPGASDNTINNNLFLTTAADQAAGTYAGTFYAKLIEAV